MLGGVPFLFLVGMFIFDVDLNATTRVGGEGTVCLKGWKRIVVGSLSYF